MDSTKKYFTEKYQNLCNYLERETIANEVLIYGTSGLLLLAAYVKRRPPFLVGQIKGVQQRGVDTLLIINHRPFILSRDLNVKLPVRVNANGYSWLQDCLIGRKATVFPLEKGKTKDFVVSQLCLVHPPKSKRLLDVSETLLKLRFAKAVKEANTIVKHNPGYYKHLQKVETNTLFKESWLSWAARHPWMWNALNNFKASVVPKQKLLPELVR